MYQEESLLALTTNNGSAHIVLEKKDSDKDSVISPDKIDQSDNDTTKGNGVDQPEPSRYSTRSCKPTILFHPGIGLARNWSSDMVVNKTLILNSH
eukprot:15336007-Ditylum_brightwellii.AAC.1